MRKQASLNKQGDPRGSAFLTKPGPDGPAIHRTNVSFGPQGAEPSRLALGPLALGLLALDRPRRMTDAELLAEVRRVAALVPEPVCRLQHFAALSPVNAGLLHRRFGDWRAALVKAGLAARAAPAKKARIRTVAWRRLDDDALLARLRAIANAKGSDALAEIDLRRRSGYLRQVLDRRFGSWRVAVVRAGLRVGGRGQALVYSEADCFANIRLLWLQRRRPPFFAELDRAPSTVGSHVYQRRWGGWRNALAAFVAAVNAAPGDPLHEAVRLWHARAAEGDARGMARPGLPAAERHSMAPALRLKVLTRDCFRCVLCGATPARDPACALELDHIKPFARGGRTEEANLRTLCHACNAGRGAADDQGRGAGIDEDRGAGAAG